jgi:hypothetical protein
MKRAIVLAILVLAVLNLAATAQDSSPAKGASQTPQSKAIPRARPRPAPPIVPWAKRQKISGAPGASAKPSGSPRLNLPAVNNVRISYAEAIRRYRHESHDRTWWNRHFTVIVLVAGGYYYWDAGYWCPAWGYDSNYAYYDYDGPIYTYGDLLPDQVILNVQRALQELGYYTGRLTGSLGGTTRAAIAAYQQNEGLFVNGVIDGPTVEALGLN